MIKLCDLPDESCPVDLHMLPNVQRATNKIAGVEQILITSSNGKLYLYNINITYEYNKTATIEHLYFEK